MFDGGSFFSFIYLFHIVEHVLKDVLRSGV